MSSSRSSSNRPSGGLPQARNWRMGIYVGEMLDDQTLHIAFYTEDVQSKNVAVHVYTTEMKNYDPKRNTADYRPLSFWVHNKHYNQVDYMRSFGDKVKCFQFQGPLGRLETVLEGSDVEQMGNIMMSIQPRWSAEWVHSLVKQLERCDIIDRHPGYSSQILSFIDEFRSKQRSQQQHQRRRR